jgi:hypothetical protein
MDLLDSGCNLDRKNPYAKDDIKHLLSLDKIPSRH